MEVIGIVAEYNPFHTGHAYQIADSRRQIGPQTPVVTVMSGNWVQQADCAILDKWSRARLALCGGADLVLELPTVWATASAESFARGAVGLLQASGVVTHLSFGSESGQISPLASIASALDRPDFSDRLSVHLARGLSFAAARQAAVCDLLPDGSALLSSANNNLGIEYLRALHALRSPIQPVTVLRQGAAHNSIEPEGSAPVHLSATQIRTMIRAGRAESLAPYLSPEALALLASDAASLDRAERAILAVLRGMSEEDWAVLPDSGAAEGLSRRLTEAAHSAAGLNEFYDRAKTKRYTHARIRRLALRAYLGIRAKDIPADPPYLRVLGFNATGRQLLRQMKQNASLPVLTKPAHARALSPSGLGLFQLESRCTDLFDLCLPQIPPPGREWTTDPVMLLSDQGGAQ